MLKEKMTFERRSAVLFTCEFNGPVEGYALAFLKLYNNAREYKDMILHVSNNSGNKVYVISTKKAQKAVHEFLDGFYHYYDSSNDKDYVIGTIVSEEEIEIGIPVYLYASSFDWDDERWEEDMDKAINWWGAVESEVQ